MTTAHTNYLPAANAFSTTLLNRAIDSKHSAEKRWWIKAFNALCYLAARVCFSLSKELWRLLFVALNCCSWIWLYGSTDFPWVMLLFQWKKSRSLCRGSSWHVTVIRHKIYSVILDAIVFRLSQQRAKVMKRLIYSDTWYLTTAV